MNIELRSLQPFAMGAVFRLLLLIVFLHVSRANLKFAPAVETLLEVSNVQDKCQSSDIRQCSRDCKRLLICSDNELIVSLNCSSNYPYCDGGKCVKGEPEGCVRTVPNLCPGSNGYYPDATSCTRYYYCNDKKETLAQYDCPIGYPFNMKLNRCASGSYCGVINCWGKSYATNPIYPNLGALCSGGKIIEGTYVACPDSYQLDETFSCAPKCTKEGLFPELGNPKGYIRCLPSGSWGSFVLTRMTCPGDLVFDAENLECTTPAPTTSTASTVSTESSAVGPEGP